MTILFVSLILTLVSYGGLYLSYRSNPTRLLNGGIFVVALFLSIMTVSSVVFLLQNRWLSLTYFVLILVVILALVFIYLFQGFFWLWNAWIVWRRENHSLANMLTLILGILTLLFPIVNNYLMGRKFDRIELFIYVFVLLMLMYTLLCVFSFMSSALLFTLRKPQPDKKFIIVLGAGLLHGDQVSPLLASRIDKGIEFFRQVEQQQAFQPLMICSGGQGNDETIPEGVAMRNYAIDHGIDSSHVVAEDQSKTTYQNMIYSKKIVVAHHLPLDSGVYVSNDYHVFRAGIYAQQAGFRIQGLGARTSRFFVPNATIREYMALLMNHKRFHIVITCMILLLSVFITILAQL